MRFVFVGPSFSGARADFPNICFRGPAVQGNIYAAIKEGATSIGLIDGCFESVASVWHKEILYALSLGIRVFGASSMGALRAAECQSFGMTPVGKIAKAYATGALDDDAAVALTNLPAEAGFLPLVEPLVDVWPTLKKLLNIGILNFHEYEMVKLASEQIYFKQRTIEAIAHSAPTRCGEVELANAYKKWRVPQKQLDAIELLRTMEAPDVESKNLNWSFESSPFWRQMVEEMTT